MGWQDDGVSLKAEISTSGTFIKPPTPTEYPFTPGSGSYPQNWLSYIPTGGNASHFSASTSSEGTFSIASTPANTALTYAYGISRNFPVTPGNTYQISVEVASGPLHAGTYPSLSIGLWKQGAGSAYTFVGNSTFEKGVPTKDEYKRISVNVPMVGNDATPINYITVLLTARSTLDQASAQWQAAFRSVYITDVTVATAPSFTWREVQCDTMDASIRFGRARFTERYDVGTFVVKLNNASGEYIYQETHPWGFRPGRMFRMSATYKGTTYPLCFGVIDRIKTVMTLDGKANVTMTVFDTTSYTSDTTTPSIWFMSPGVINDPKALSGNRINALLNFTGVAQSLRLIDPGIFSMSNVVESGRAVREEIGVTADSEGGSFFGERDGKVVYRDRSWSSRDPRGGTVQAQFTAYPGTITIDPQPDDIPTDPNAPTICPQSMDTDWSLERVINTILLAVVGRSKRQYINIPSQQEHGVRTYQRLDFVNWTGPAGSIDAQLQARANDIFSTSLDALLRVQQLSYRPGEGTWEFTFTFFLDWLVRVFYYIRNGTWGFATVVRVQSIEHRITPTDWVVSIDVDQPISYTGDIEPIPPATGMGWDDALWNINIWDQEKGDDVPLSGAYWNSGQVWNGDRVTWLGHGWTTGAKWSAAEDDWKA